MTNIAAPSLNQFVGSSAWLAARRQSDGIFHVKDFGAYGNTRHVNDAVINGSTTVTSATAIFTATDVGKIVYGVESASGGLRLPRGTIITVNSATSIVVSIAAIGTYSNIILVLGADDTDAIQEAGIAAKALTPKGTVVFSAGGYLFRKCLFDLSNTGPVTTDCIAVIGAGSGATILYIDPSIDLTTTEPGNGLFCKNTTGQNIQRLKLCGFTINGCHYNFTAGYRVIYAKAPQSLYEDERILNCVSVTGLLAFGALSLFSHIHVEQCLLGIEAEVGVTFIESYTGNCGNGKSLQVGGGLNGTIFSWIGGIVDESNGGSAHIANGDAVFISSLLFAPQNQTALSIDGTSIVRAFGSRIIPFGGPSDPSNRSGVTVASGGILYLSGCLIDKSAAGVALTNAGVVYDMGGNVITGVSGTNPVNKFGTHAAIGAETITGFIQIHDSAGTPRKLAVVS